jgi:cytochrome c oxidase subunit 2
MPIHGRRSVSKDDYSKWVEGKKKEMAATADDPDQGLDARRPGRRAARRSTPPTAWPATRPAGKGVPGAIQALDGSAVVLGADKSQPDRWCCSTARTTAPCRRGSSCPTPSWPPVITYTTNAWCNKAGQHGAARAEVVAARK